MKIKLDENLGNATAQIFRDAGYDAETVRQEGLAGADDRRVIEICQSEKRCLVTLDMDFSNPFVFDPTKYHGIAVLRIPANPSYQDILDFSRTLLAGLSNNDIHGKLWIVQRHQIRIYQPQ